MSKKLSLLLLALVLTALLCSGCRGCPPCPQPEEEGAYPTWQGENVAYISIDLDGRPHIHKEVVDAAISNWKRNNPDSEMLNMQIEYQPDAYGSRPRTYGIWVFLK